MAVQADRRGLESQLDKNKLLPGENATTTDTHKTFKAFAPGVVKRMATYEDTVDMLDEALEEVKQNFTEGVEEAIDNAEIATGNANTATGHATTQGDFAKTQGDYAKAQGDAVASIVNDSIASETVPGNVRGGGDVKVDTLTGDMSVSEASSANVTVVEAEEDGEITTGLLGAIIGLIKKKFSVMLNDLAGKIDKASIVQSVEISDATKVPSSVITSWLASQISSLASSLTTLNNNLAAQTVRGHGNCNTINGFTIPISLNVAYRLDILTFVAVPSTSASYLILGGVFIDATYEGVSPYAPRATMSGAVVTVKLNEDTEIRNVRYLLTTVI